MAWTKEDWFLLHCFWGAFESGKAIRRRALALNLSTYKQKKTINYNLSQLKKAYSDEVRLENYRKI